MARLKPSESWWSRLLMGVCLLAWAGLWMGAAAARPLAGTVGWEQLPPQARHTIVLIRAGGPFPYARKDGSVFANREGALPRRPRGYYREYTVPTPGVRDRGPRRIVAGSGPGRDVRTSGEYYYTDDHYASFRRVTDLPSD